MVENNVGGKHIHSASGRASVVQQIVTLWYTLSEQRHTARVQRAWV